MVKMVPLPPGEAVLVDELGSVVIETLPAAEKALLLELGGELVRSDGERFTGKFLFAPGQVGELIADLVSTMAASGEEVMPLLKAELARILARDVSEASAESLVDRAEERAKEHGGPMSVVGLTGPDGSVAGEAAVFRPWPNEQFGGELFCRVRFQGGGPWDGETKDVPVSVACAGFAASAGEVEVEVREEPPDGG